MGHIGEQAPSFIKRGWLAHGLAGAAGVVYLASFALPVFDNTGMPFQQGSVAPQGVVLGIEAFLFAIPPLLTLFPAWLANPAFWLGLRYYFRRRYRRSLVEAIASLCFGLTALVLLGDATIAYRQQYLSGYYSWLASFVLLALASLLSANGSLREVPVPANYEGPSI